MKYPSLLIGYQTVWANDPSKTASHASSRAESLKGDDLATVREIERLLDEAAAEPEAAKL